MSTFLDTIKLRKQQNKISMNNLKVMSAFYKGRVPVSVSNPEQILGTLKSMLFELNDISKLIRPNELQAMENAKNKVTNDFNNRLISKEKLINSLNDLDEKMQRAKILRVQHNDKTDDIEKYIAKYRAYLPDGGANIIPTHSLDIRDEGYITKGSQNLPEDELREYNKRRLERLISKFEKTVRLHGLHISIHFQRMFAMNLHNLENEALSEKDKSNIIENMIEDLNKEILNLMKQNRIEASLYNTTVRGNTLSESTDFGSNSEPNVRISNIEQIPVDLINEEPTPIKKINIDNEDLEKTRLPSTTTATTESPEMPKPKPKGRPRTVRIDTTVKKPTKVESEKIQREKVIEDQYRKSVEALNSEFGNMQIGDDTVPISTLDFDEYMDSLPKLQQRSKRRKPRKKTAKIQQDDDDDDDNDDADNENDDVDDEVGVRNLSESAAKNVKGILKKKGRGNEQIRRRDITL